MKAIALVVLFALAGCTEPEAPVEEPQTTEEPKPPQLSGFVLNEELVALHGANITVLETGERTTAASDGSYRFDGLPVQTPLVLVARAPDHQPLSKRVLLQANQSLRIDFQLPLAPEATPYQETIGRQGFLDCRSTVETEDNHQEFDCSGGAGRTDNVWEFGGAEGLAGGVVEVHWEPGQPAAAAMQAKLETVGTGDQATALDEAVGESPLKLRLSGEQAARFYSEGGLMRLTVGPSANLEENEMGAGAAMAFQQEFQMLAALFYVEGPPPDWSFDQQ